MKECHYCHCNATCKLGKQTITQGYIYRNVCDFHRDLLLGNDWEEIAEITC